MVKYDIYALLCQVFAFTSGFIPTLRSNCVAWYFLLFDSMHMCQQQQRFTRIYSGCLNCNDLTDVRDITDGFVRCEQGILLYGIRHAFDK